MDRPPGGRVPPEAREEDLDQELADMGFLCPITQGLFRDPVVARDGHTYEVHNLAVFRSFLCAVLRRSDRGARSKSGFAVETTRHLLQA